MLLPASGQVDRWGKSFGKPDDVCLQLGKGAQFVIDQGMGRKITKDEAMEILDQSEEAGLVHCTNNRQEIDFLCNCCSCHCVILRNAMAQPKPGLAVNSGFQPLWNYENCTACATCIERCPIKAVCMGEDDEPKVDPEQCIGCGVCATGCPTGKGQTYRLPLLIKRPLRRWLRRAWPARIILYNFLDSKK